jgi:hypothetical protein
MGVQSEGKPSNVKPYQHPHYQEIFQGRQEDRYQHYQGRRWNTHQYSWNRASQNHYSIGYYQRPTTTTKLEKLQQQYMESRKENYATTSHQGLRPKIIEFGWMDHHQWKEECGKIRKSYYLVSSHVKPLKL